MNEELINLLLEFIKANTRLGIILSILIILFFVVFFFFCEVE